MSTLYWINTIATVLVIVTATAGAALSLTNGDTAALPWQITTVAGFTVALVHMRRPNAHKQVKEN